MNLIKDDNTKDTNVKYDDVLLSAWKTTLDLGEFSTESNKSDEILRKYSVVLSNLTILCFFLSGVIGLVEPASQWIVLLGLVAIVVIYCVVKWRDFLSEQVRSATVFVIGFVGLIIGYIIFPDVLSISNFMPILLGFLTVINIAYLINARGSLGSIWIDYRGYAEELRSAIYVYRVKKFLLNEKGADDADLLQVQRDLSNKISEVSSKVSELSNWIPYLKPSYSTEDLVRRIEWRSYDAAPLDTLSIQDYVKIRVEDLRDWYSMRVQRDHTRFWYNKFIFHNSDRLAIFVALAQFLTLIYAIFFGLDMLSIVFANIAWIIQFAFPPDNPTSQHDIFHGTAAKLEMRLKDWYMEDQKDQEKILAFVQDVESILHDEIAQWKPRAKAEASRIRNWTTQASQSHAQAVV